MRELVDVDVRFSGGVELGDLFAMLSVEGVLVGWPGGEDQGHGSD
jgi:hypothetical protein